MTFLIKINYRIELVVKFSFIRACVVQMLFCQKGAQKYNFENFYFNSILISILIVALGHEISRSMLLELKCDYLYLLKREG